MHYTIANETLEFLAARAIYWPHAGALFIADTHWGKAATFRAAGIALPGGTTTTDLERLNRMLAGRHVSHLYILGDLLHARTGRADQTMAAVEAWRARWPDLAITLVRGNHDRGAGDPPAKWGFSIADEPLQVGPFALRHMPVPTPGSYTLAGHLHPGIALPGIGKLPCFWVGANVTVLPAFGSFTGLATVAPAPGDRVFVIAEDDVIAVR